MIREEDWMAFLRDRYGLVPEELVEDSGPDPIEERIAAVGREGTSNANLPARPLTTGRKPSDKTARDLER